MHDPVVEVATTEMLRAAMVVFEDFEGVPVTVTQVPAVNEFTASVTDLEKDVVDVQFTVVWPLLGFCTSMVEPDSAATLPVAPMGALAGVVAAPAADAIVVAVTSATAPSGELGPAPAIGASAGRCLHVEHSSAFFYSVRRASMGARWAARLAG